MTIAHPVETPAAISTPDKQTRIFKRSDGPFVVDTWQPAQPSGAPPVLLVHGWGGTGSYWEPTANYLAQTVPVIVPDLPGTGRSQPVRTPHDMYDQVETLAFLLDALELDRVQIVGHSMGGAMSVLLAADHGDRIDRLILTSLTFFMTRQQENVYHGVMKAFSLMMHFRPSWLVDVPGVTRVMAKQYFHRVPDDAETLRLGLSAYLDLDRGTAMACAANATDPIIRESGYKLTMPVMLIAAEYDQMMPTENVDFTAGIIPDCSVRWIKNSGHLPMIEKADEYRAILREFLAL